MELIALACPRCSAALPTAGGRRVFVCGECGTTSLPPADLRAQRAGGLVVLPRAVVRPRLPWPSVGSIVLLPVWVVPVLRPRDPGPADRLPAEVRLPAVGYDRFEVLLRFAAHLSRVEIPWEAMEPGPALSGLVRSPGEITAAEALAAAQPVLFSMAGDAAGALESAGAVPLGAPSLVDLPCQLVGGRICDLVCDRWAPDVLLEANPLPDQRAALTAALAASRA